MLTSDLLRARVLKGIVRPRYLEPEDPDHLARAAALVAMFASHVGQSRGALDDALGDLVGEDTDFLMHRGLAKLLTDRTDFAIDSAIPPADLRRRVFERAVLHHPVAVVPGDRVHTVTRADVLADVARELGWEPHAVEGALYADLEREQKLTSFDTIAPSALLHRYNLALAQAVLYRATALRIVIAPGDPARYRQLFRFVKFYRLMHTVHGSRGAGYTITLDGPASLFQLSSKYGLLMAEFLPALLLCEAWSLEADVLWGKERKAVLFKLAPDEGLRSHYPDKGVYVTDEEKFFVAKFETVKTAWVLDKRPELIDLGGRGVLVPDLVLRHADGREAYLEILGFWRKGSLQSRIELLKQHGPPNLVLAVSKRLRGSEDDLAEVPGSVMFFKDVIPTREVLERVERVAVAP